MGVPIVQESLNTDIYQEGVKCKERLVSQMVLEHAVVSGYHVHSTFSALLTNLPGVVAVVCTASNCYRGKEFSLQYIHTRRSKSGQEMSETLCSTTNKSHLIKHGQAYVFQHQVSSSGHK